MKLTIFSLLRNGIGKHGAGNACGYGRGDDEGQGTGRGYSSGNSSSGRGACSGAGYAGCGGLNYMVEETWQSESILLYEINSIE